MTTCRKLISYLGISVRYSFYLPEPRKTARVHVSDASRLRADRFFNVDLGTRVYIRKPTSPITPHRHIKSEASDPAMFSLKQMELKGPESW